MSHSWPILLIVVAILVNAIRSTAGKSARIGRTIAASREPGPLDAVANERLATILRTEHGRVAAAGLDAQSVERALAGLAQLRHGDAPPIPARMPDAVSAATAIVADVAVRSVVRAVPSRPATAWPSLRDRAASAPSRPRLPRAAIAPLEARAALRRSRPLVPVLPQAPLAAREPRSDSWR